MLEALVAQLWDEVWWHQLPFYKRWYYALAEKHRSPIKEFYLPYYKKDGGKHEWPH